MYTVFSKKLWFFSTNYQYFATSLLPALGEGWVSVDCEKNFFFHFYNFAAVYCTVLLICYICFAVYPNAKKDGIDFQNNKLVFFDLKTRIRIRIRDPIRI